MPFPSCRPKSPHTPLSLDDGVVMIWIEVFVGTLVTVIIVNQVLLPHFPLRCIWKFLQEAVVTRNSDATLSASVSLCCCSVITSLADESSIFKTHHDHLEAKHPQGSLIQQSLSCLAGVLSLVAVWRHSPYRPSWNDSLILTCSLILEPMWRSSTCSTGAPACSPCGSRWRDSRQLFTP